VLKQEWQIDLNLFLHHWLKDYEVVKAWDIKVLGGLKVESIGKMNFCDNKQTNLSIVLSMDAYKMLSWEFCMVKTNPKNMVEILEPCWSCLKA
jgi:hypothetical protein